MTSSTKKAPLTWYNIFIVFFVCLGGISYGFCFSIFATSIGQPGFYAYFELDPSSDYTANILGAVSALFNAGAAIGAICQGWMSDNLGRKWTIAIASITVLISAALIAGSVNLPMLIVFRFVEGLALGMIISLVPLYIVEVSPAHRRGFLAGCTACSLACGYLTAAFVGYGSYFAESQTVQWRLPLALATIAPLILVSGIYWIPESPRFYVLRGRNDEAWQIVQKIHGNPLESTQAAATAEFIQITRQNELVGSQKTGYIDMFRKPSWRKRCLLVLFMMFATQSAGILGIAVYSVLIYQSLGLTGSKSLLMYCIYIVVGSLVNFLSAGVMDKIGRRKMFLIGYPATAACLLATALLQKTYVGTDSVAGNAAALFFIFLYECLYGFFLDAPQFTWIAEVFPTEIRSKGIALAWFAYFVGAITYTTPGALAFKNIGWKYYMVWFSCNIVSTVVIYFYVPETRNLPLEEIGALFGDEVAVHLTEDGRGIVEDKVAVTQVMNEREGNKQAVERVDQLPSKEVV